MRTFKSFRIKLPSGERYWTVVDDSYRPVQGVDDWLLHLRIGRDCAESTTESYAGALALFFEWCASIRTAGEFGRFVYWLQHYDPDSPPGAVPRIEILSDVPGNAGGAKVHVVANFGDSKSDDTITVPKPAEGQGWKLVPRDCPQSAASRWDLVDGTVVWTAPHNLDAVSAQTLNPDSGIAQLDGEVTFTFMGQTRDGATTTGTDTARIAGQVDMTHNPPKVELR